MDLGLVCGGMRSDREARAHTGQVRPQADLQDLEPRLRAPMSARRAR